MSGVAEARATKIREMIPTIFPQCSNFYVEYNEQEIAVWVGEKSRIIELRSSFEKGEVVVNAPWRLAASSGRRLRDDSWTDFDPNKLEEFVRELFSKE